jgi:hypothetical protein
LNLLRQSGAVVPDWYFREDMVIPKSKIEKRNYEGISLGGVLGDVNRYLKEFDPEGEKNE